MQYYEDDFLEFEEFAKFTGLEKTAEKCTTDGKSVPDFILEKFEKYEKWMKADRRRQWKKYVKTEQKKLKYGKKCTTSADTENVNNHLQVESFSKFSHAI